MTFTRSKKVLFTLTRALLLAFLAVVVTWDGYLARFEHDLYSERFIHCQYFTPPPDKDIRHLDIDDLAMAQIGRWPWPRSVIADIIDEIALAKPKVLAMDNLFSEPGLRTYDRNGQKVDEDAIFASAIQRFGRALIPVSVAFGENVPPGPLKEKLTELLVNDPERSIEQCIDLLQSEGINAPNLQSSVNGLWLSVLPPAIYERIRRELSLIPDSPNTNPRAFDPDAIRKKVLPHSNPLVDSPLDRIFDEQYAVAVSERAMLRFTMPIPKALRSVLNTNGQITPILPIANAAAYSGFVDYLPDSVEGTVHSVPLVVNYRGRLIPHFALATACAVLGVDVHDLQLHEDSVTIPRPDGTNIVIPVSTRPSTAIGDAGMLMEIPMFGRKDSWETMYDYPRHEKVAQHISVYAVWQACHTRQLIELNERSADALLVKALSLTDAKAAEDYGASPLKGKEKRALITSTLENTDALIAAMSGPELDDASRTLLNNYKQCSAPLHEYLIQDEAFNRQLAKLRAYLAEELGGKPVFFGGTATGHLDMHPTSLFYTCPGIVIHGAIFNAIMTGKMWRIAPESINLSLTALMGILTAIIVGVLQPLRAFFASVFLASGYLAINGYYLFDYHSLIVEAAGPSFAIALVYIGTTLTNFVTEIAEHNRIKRRFRNYVDPALVNWVLEHPDQARFDGESREMTIGFTDLAGFTALMDHLGEKTIPILAEYMGEMVPVIRAHTGYVAKLMGDGIYFFFGAPKPDPNHAAHAVAALLDMRTAFDNFNMKLQLRGEAPLGMRAGLSTGQVIIGDAGPPDCSDYTALGPTTNLASRLESANKVFGTYALVTERTIELLNGSHLVRPIAHLVVAGKSIPVSVFEPICAMNKATTEQCHLAEQTQAMVDAYRAGKFAACIAGADNMDRLFGPGKLADFYRTLSQEYLANPPTDFDGRVVLTEK